MGWCVAMTKPQQGDLAVKNLERQGFRVFNPLLREHKGKRVITKAMFPGYLFVELLVGEESEWKSAHYSFGVQRVIHATLDRPSYLPTGFVENLLLAGGVIDHFEEVIKFQKGNQLIVTEGPFAGQVGICHWSGEKRVAILLSLLGRQTIVVSEPSNLKMFMPETQAVVR